MQKRKSENRTCTYCGKFAEITADHIPPKSIFPTPRPNNLVTVPSCIACNSGASKDDEYFRLNLSIRDKASTPSARKAAENSMRAFTRVERNQFRESFFRGIREVEILSRSGIFLGQGATYSVDLARLDRVSSRIVTGLFFHHYGKRLPSGSSVDTWCLDGFEKADPAVQLQLHNFVSQLKALQPITIGDGAFRYWHNLFHQDGINDEYRSIWLLEFYEGTTFFGITVGQKPQKSE